MSKRISTGVMKTNEWENEVMYRVMCECGSNEHDATISMEYDKELNFFSLIFWKNLCWCSRWGTDKWYEKLWKRVSCSLKMLFTGYIEVEEEMLIRDLNHIDDFITALIDGRVMLARGHSKIESEMKELNKPDVPEPKCPLDEKSFKTVDLGYGYSPGSKATFPK